MSAPERQAAGRRAPAQSAAGVELSGLAADLIEVAALRHQAGELEARARQRGVTLPAPGRLAAAGGQLVLCVRPERWLLITAPAAPGARAGQSQSEYAGCAAVVELSSALAKLHLAGAAVRELLARGCRLDLDAEAFPAGCAAATLIAQVPVILAALPAGLLLLTPATTAQHLREWLESGGRPFALVRAADVTVGALCGDELP
ncbi:MAG TPA: sarcosine oxidase subunit gamma family protein [Steroidobacteraceae bacterium]|nr:sarcosine oxidase subunit gamma family protein [Steroidobacteraceae bacterium]